MRFKLFTFNTRLYVLLGSIILFSGCEIKNEASAHLLTADDVSQWIGDNKPLPESDSLFYHDDPAPLFRKEFNVEGELKSAKLLLTSAGYYRAAINGKRVGRNMFDPAWTNFGKRVYYTEYDIAELLDSKTNCLGVTVGNGFYNPLPMKMWGHLNLREYLPVGRPVFIAKIVLEYKNGKTEEIGTDETWKYSYGPLLKNNVYLGEVYDERKEVKGWNLAGFDDSSWHKAVNSDGPGGELQTTFFPPVKVLEKINPVKIISVNNETYIADMGVNFTGTYRIKLKGEPGDSVVFRFGERMYPDGTLNPMTAVCGQIKSEGRGGPGAPAVAWQTDTYIFGSNDEVWYQPEFTFHTYRYMEIKGLKNKPSVNDIEGLFTSTDFDVKNHFSTSSGLINSIQEITLRTFLANLISVQSDCAAREKFGYGGDLNATSEAFIYNYDMQSFYKKTIYDWVDAINDSVFIDTAPFVGIKNCGLSWESAVLITQYYLYLYYNDVEFVKEMYEFNKRWMDKVVRIHPEDWVDKGLGDHESLIRVSPELTGNGHYLHCAEIMQKFALIMKDASAEKQYGQLADKIRLKLKKEYWDKPVTEEINRQTLFSTLLYYNVIPENETTAAVDSLLNALDNAPAGHFTTGIFGTKYILEVLSKYYSPEKVFQIVNSTEFPGWGHMIAAGGTTIWETWKESDNVYSNCHPMFGSVTEWFYRWLGGIRPHSDYPGFEKFILNPFIPEGLEEVSSSYNSPYGKIVSNWKKSGIKAEFEMEIPAGTSAFVKLNKEPAQKIDVKKINDNAFNPGLTENQATVEFELKGGKYLITIQ